jgi:oligopeptide/dipeptide ABC transporter ATP-binding protein
MIRGVPPDPTESLVGCVFKERCPYALPSCDKVTMALEPVSPEHATACPVRPFSATDNTRTPRAGAQV